MAHMPARTHNAPGDLMAALPPRLPMKLEARVVSRRRERGLDSAGDRIAAGRADEAGLDEGSSAPRMKRALLPARLRQEVIHGPASDVDPLERMARAPPLESVEVGIDGGGEDEPAGRSNDSSDEPQQGTGTWEVEVREDGEQPHDVERRVHGKADLVLECSGGLAIE